MSAKKWLCKICADGCYLAGTDSQISFCRLYKPQTNADRIRAMSDEELAELLCTDHCVQIRGNNKLCDGTCFLCVEEWLRQPMKDGDNNGR